MKTPQDQFDIAQRIYTLAKRIEQRAIACVGYAWIIEDARELVVIGFDLLTEAKEALPKEDSAEDKLL